MTFGSPRTALSGGAAAESGHIIGHTGTEFRTRWLVAVKRGVGLAG
jgi:hypothetical protein